MLNQGTVIEGRCADCVMDLLQLSGMGPGRYGYCRLRRIVLEYPWAMVCQHYQYWGDRPTPGKPRVLVDRAVHPLLDYSTQEPIQVMLTPEDLRSRHENEGDDDIKRNVGATFNSREFIESGPEKQYDLLNGYLSGYNPYNFVIAANALHHFPLETFTVEKRRSLLEKLVAPERKVKLNDGPGIVADKLAFSVGWALIRTGRDLPEYIDSLRLKKHNPDYERKLLKEILEFIRNPDIRPKRSILRFLLGR